MKKLVVFDLDGTLNRTDLYAVDALKNALADFHITGFSEKDIISYFGAAPENYVKVYLPDADDETRKRFLRAAAEHENILCQKHHAEFEGITPTLQKLKAEGYLTAVCSNSSHRYISMMLNLLDLMQYIDYIQPISPTSLKDDSLRTLLTNVSPDAAVMVGDRVFDLNAARANNIPFIGCAYGYNPEELQASDYLADSGYALYDGVKKLIG